MSIDIWVSFLVASIVLCFTPGPTVFIVMAQSINYGKRSVLPLVSGVLAGDVIAMSVSFVGLGALLAASAMLFNVFKWMAGAYLIYLGIKAWKSKVQQTEEPTNLTSSKNAFKEALIVTALNPKGIVFFIAFFPLFININAPVLPQMAIMAGTFLLVSGSSASFYSLFSGLIRNRVQSAKIQTMFNKTSGAILASAGVVTATMQKSN